jgi:histidine triad (HIT) family protein
MSCIFCDIVNKKIPANIVFESDDVLAFEDISPQAPTHILVIPKKHIANILEIESNDVKLLGNLLEAVRELASKFGIKDRGFRVVTNTGDEGGQTVHHLHFHLLGGRPLSWPPG